MQDLRPNTTLQGGKYRIERVLGQGGFGITYLAIQVSLNRYVAIKELFIGGSGQAINDRRGNLVVVTNSANQSSFNQQKEKFKKEAMRLAQLNHPNLVKVHEFFEENGTAYYVMDYIEGESLRTKLNREGLLSESLVLKYLQQLLPALEAAHKQSIWHLDIKPENIMVDRYGHVYLIDFGASKHVEPNSTLTTSLALAYTPGYCPPELLDLSNETPEYYLQAIKDIGPWTDIYALGATIYNLLTDSIPPSKRRLDKEGRNAFSFSSNISSSTQDLIIWMMKSNKEERPQNVLSLQKWQDGDEEGTIYADSPKDAKDPQTISVNNHDAVDLGLSVLWATMDIGASSEKESGEGFLWGDPDGRKSQQVKESSWSRWFSGGPKINKICGNANYDTATCLWGKDWRMPTGREFQELAEKCTWEVEDDDHVRLTGPNGKSILLGRNIHWTGEKPFGYVTLFAWGYQQNELKWRLLTNRDLGKSFTELYLQIRPVCEKRV